MGHILGLLQALVPRSTAITVEDTIIQDMGRPKIYCEIICPAPHIPTHVHLETSISTSIRVEVLSAVVQSGLGPLGLEVDHGYHWSGWLAYYLQLTFLNAGLHCNQAILNAVVNFLMLLPEALKVGDIKYGSEGYRFFVSTPLVVLLGPLPWARMRKICENILGSTLTPSQLDLKTAYVTLMKTVTDASPRITCQRRRSYTCDWNHGWDTPGWRRRRDRRDCKLYCLWKAIGASIDCGLWSFSINVGPSESVCPSAERSLDYINCILKDENDGILGYEQVISYVFDLGTGVQDHKCTTAASSGACTIYPDVFQSSVAPTYQSALFTLLEGQLI